MAALASLLLIAATAAVQGASGASDSAPSRVRKALAAVTAALDPVQRCVDRFPQLGLTRDIDGRFNRYWTVESRVAEVWGDIPQISPGAPERKVACTRASVGKALRRVDSVLDAANAEVKRALLPFAHGVWAGPLQLCDATVRGVSRQADALIGQPALAIDLTPAAGRDLAILTERRIGRPLAVRLDGVVVMRPLVYEAIYSGALQFSGPDADTLEALRRAMLAAC